MMTKRGSAKPEANYFVSLSSFVSRPQKRFLRLRMGSMVSLPNVVPGFFGDRGSEISDVIFDLPLAS